MRLLKGLDISEDEDMSSYSIQFPDFEQIKKDLEEKYKLTPEELEYNKMVRLGKEWGTRTDGVEITSLSKAEAASEEYAYLLKEDLPDNRPRYLWVCEDCLHPNLTPLLSRSCSPTSPS